MHTLSYINRNFELYHLKIQDFESCIPIPEDLIFVALRQGINIVKEPSELIDFTDLERLIIGLNTFDLSFIKESDFRKQNTTLCPVVEEQTGEPILPYFEDDMIIYGSGYNPDENSFFLKIKSLKTLEELIPINQSLYINNEYYRMLYGFVLPVGQIDEYHHFSFPIPNTSGSFQFHIRIDDESGSKYYPSSNLYYDIS